MTALLKQSTGLSVFICQQLSAAPDPQISMHNPRAWQHPRRGARQSHGDLVNPDRGLLFIYLCTDRARQSGWRLIPVCFTTGNRRLQNTSRGGGSEALRKDITSCAR